MNHSCGTRVRREAGFTMIELLIVVGIIGILSAIAVPLFQRALLKSQKAAMAADARAVYDAFMRYYTDNSFFPSTSSPATRAFNLSTMSPLTTGGYVKQPGAITSKLRNNQFTAYDSPNAGSSDTQFWVVMTNKKNPSLVVLVANTNQYPSSMGTWYDGIFFIQGTNIIPLRQAL
jgi:prepilin-type N-terminal cleavage/methylation domain-containing protein